MPLNPVEITGGLAIGEGVGGAIEATVEPRLQNFKNGQWAKHMVKPLDPADAAAAEQQGYTGNLSGITDASFSGIDGDRYLALRYLAATAPGTPELLELWRRGKLTPELVRVGLKKAGLMDEFVEAVLELFTGRLDPAIIAVAIQRGVMRAPFDLPYNVDVPVGNVTPFPVSALDAEAEAKAHGIDTERLRIETALVGLPMALDRAAQAHFRGILTDGDYLRAVLEGNARGEWADAELEVARQILTAGQYAELELRGYYNRATRLGHTAKHGMSDADSDLLYNVLGRSIAVHQITTGLERGGKYPGSYANVPQPYKAAIQRSNIREEYSELAYANRYTFSVPFWWRAMAQAGALAKLDPKQILLDLGNPPAFADAAVAFYVGTATTATDPHVAKAETHLWNTVHASYKAEESTQADITPALNALGIDATSQTTIVSLWDAERALIRAQLTPKQIVKALGEGVTNPATGAPWTVADATAALMARGYSQADATVLIQE